MLHLRSYRTGSRFPWNPMKTDAVGARGRTPAGTLRPSPFVWREVDRAAPSVGARIRYRPYTDGGMSSSVWPLIGSCVAPFETNSGKSGNSIARRVRLFKPPTVAHDWIASFSRDAVLILVGCIWVRRPWPLFERRKARVGPTSGLRACARTRHHASSRRHADGSA